MEVHSLHGVWGALPYHPNNASVAKQITKPEKWWLRGLVIKALPEKVSPKRQFCSARGVEISARRWAISFPCARKCLELIWELKEPHRTHYGGDSRVPDVQVEDGSCKRSYRLFPTPGEITRWKGIALVMASYVPYSIPSCSGLFGDITDLRESAKIAFWGNFKEKIIWAFKRQKCKAKRWEVIAFWFSMKTKTRCWGLGKITNLRETAKYRSVGVNLIWTRTEW